MNESTPKKAHSNSAASDDPNSARSESLLPAAPEDSTEDNASFGVAEEVSLDQQSDRVRQMGNLPPDGAKTPAGSAATAIAESLSPEPDDDSVNAERAAPPKQGD